MKKIADVVEKCKYLLTLKRWKKNSNVTRSYASTYYQTLEEVLWCLGLQDSKNYKKIQKNWKNFEN